MAPVLPARPPHRDRTAGAQIHPRFMLMRLGCDGVMGSNGRPREGAAGVVHSFQNEYEKCHLAGRGGHATLGGRTMNSRPTSCRLERRITVALAILSGVMALGVRSAHPQEEAIRDALRVQEARNKRVAERGKKAWYTKQWDLSGLPKYLPQQKVTGVLRIWGNNYLADGMLG